MTGHNKGKKGNRVWQPAEWCRAPSQSRSHGNQASEEASEIQNKRMTKCSPCPLILLLSAAPNHRWYSQASCGKVKMKTETDVEDNSNDRWDETGGAKHKMNKKLKKKKSRREPFSSTSAKCKNTVRASRCCQQGRTVRPAVELWGTLSPPQSHSWCFHTLRYGARCHTRDWVSSKWQHVWKSKRKTQTFPPLLLNFTQHTFNRWRWNS